MQEAPWADPGAPGIHLQKRGSQSRYRNADAGERRILAITEDIMFKWRLLVEDGRKAGHTFSQPDLIIAATARHHGLTVVSRDVSDYQKARAPVLNPVGRSTAGGPP
jgi:predicted nucleic acid-binding protein